MSRLELCAAEEHSALPSDMAVGQMPAHNSKGGQDPGSRELAARCEPNHTMLWQFRSIAIIAASMVGRASHG